jgi:hypothetical protein
MISFLLTRQSICAIVFLQECVPSVSFILQHVLDRGVLPDGLPVPRCYVKGVHIRRDFITTLPTEEPMEYLPNQLGLRLEYFQLISIQSVSKWAFAGIESTIFHSHLYTQASVLRDRLTFLLRHGGKNGGQHLSGHFCGINMLLLKGDPNTQGLQLADSLQTLCCIPCEP